MRCRRILRIRGQYFFTQYFHFCRSARKESDPADFFQTLALLHRTFFIYFYYTLTLQSSPPRYMWLTYPHPFARVWAPWHFCKKKKTRLPSSTSEMLDKMTLIPNPNAENTARSQLYGEKKIVFQYARDLCPPRPGTITQQIQPAEQGGCEEFRHSSAT